MKTMITRLLLLPVLVAAATLAGCQSPPPPEPAAGMASEASARTFAVAQPDAAGSDSPQDDGTAAQPSERPQPALAGIDPANVAQHRATAADPAALAEALADRIDADLAVSAAVERSPAVVAARERVRAIEAEHGQLDALRRTLATYESFVADSSPLLARPSATARPGAAAFPLPGRDGLRSQLVSLAVDVAQQEVDRVARSEARRVRTILAQGWFWQESLLLLQDQRTLLDTARDSVSARFRTGNADLIDLLRIDERIARMDARIESAQLAIAEQQSLLRERLSLPSNPTGRFVSPSPEPSAAPVPLPPEAIAAVVRHPRVVAVEAQEARLRTMIELVETMSQPTIDLRLSRLTLPLSAAASVPEPQASRPAAPWFGMSEAYRAELLHRAEAMHAMRDAAARELRDQAERAAADRQDAWLSYRLATESLQEIAGRYADSTVAALEAGGVTIEVVLDALRAKLDAAQDRIGAQREFAVAQATLTELLG